MLLVPEECHPNHRRAMKIHKIAVWGCLLLAGEAMAQVVNETCGQSIVPHSGILDVGHNCVCGSIGVWGSGFGLDDGTLNLAVPDFPYPTMPLSCTGYATTVSAPAADVWYYFAYTNGTADQLCLESDDTVHVSLWVGRCDSLMPWGCYTVLPFTPTSMLLPMYIYQDTLRIQVAGTAISSTADFQMCIEYTPGIPNTDLFAWQYPTPTPVCGTRWRCSLLQGVLMRMVPSQCPPWLETHLGPLLGTTVISGLYAKTCYQAPMPSP